MPNLWGACRVRRRRLRGLPRRPQNPAMPSLRVVTPSFFADDVRASLTIPADVIAVDGEAGPEMAAAIADADVLLNGVFQGRECKAPRPRLLLIQALGGLRRHRP